MSDKNVEVVKVDDVREVLTSFYDTSIDSLFDYVPSVRSINSKLASDLDLRNFVVAQKEQKSQDGKVVCISDYVRWIAMYRMGEALRVALDQIDEKSSIDE